MVVTEETMVTVLDKVIALGVSAAHHHLALLVAVVVVTKYG